MASAMFQSPSSCPPAMPCPSGEVSVGGITSWRVLSISLGEDLLGTLGNGIFQKCSHVRNMGHINLLKSKNQSFKDPPPPLLQTLPPRESPITAPCCMKRMWYHPCPPLKQASYPFERCCCFSTRPHGSDDLTWRLKCRRKPHWRYNMAYDINIWLF